MGDLVSCELSDNPHHKIWSTDATSWILVVWKWWKRQTKTKEMKNQTTEPFPLLRNTNEDNCWKSNLATLSIEHWLFWKSDRHNKLLSIHIAYLCEEKSIEVFLLKISSLRYHQDLSQKALKWSLLVWLHRDGFASLANLSA